MHITVGGGSGRENPDGGAGGGGGGNPDGRAGGSGGPPDGRNPIHGAGGGAVGSIRLPHGFKSIAILSASRIPPGRVSG